MKLSHTCQDAVGMSEAPGYPLLKAHLLFNGNIGTSHLGSILKHEGDVIIGAFLHFGSEVLHAGPRVIGRKAESRLQLVLSQSMSLRALLGIDRTLIGILGCKPC